jgi:hypothetical protein
MLAYAHVHACMPVCVRECACGCVRVCVRMREGKGVRALGVCWASVCIQVRRMQRGEGGGGGTLLLTVEAMLRPLSHQQTRVHTFTHAWSHSVPPPFPHTLLGRWW